MKKTIDFQPISNTIYEKKASVSFPKLPKTFPKFIKAPQSFPRAPPELLKAPPSSPKLPQSFSRAPQSSPQLYNLGLGVEGVGGWGVGGWGLGVGRLGIRDRETTAARPSYKLEERAPTPSFIGETAKQQLKGHPTNPRNERAHRVSSAKPRNTLNHKP